MSSRYGLAVKGMLAAAFLLWLPISCRTIIGIPDGDISVDPKVLDDAGGDGSGGSISPLCEDYCNTMDEYCTGKNQMYPSKVACLGVCARLPAGMKEDNIGNSISCRSTFAASHEEGECQKAGPLGGGACGDRCEVYCDLVKQVCPAQFESFKDQEGCLKACRALPYHPPYSAETEPHENSLSCRMYHLSSATFNAAHHCPHTIGIEYCPDADAGSGGGDGGVIIGDGGGGSSGDGGDDAGSTGSGGDADHTFDGGILFDAGFASADGR